MKLAFDPREKVKECCRCNNWTGFEEDIGHCLVCGEVRREYDECDVEVTEC
jgi:hypothetical protein